MKLLKLMFLCALFFFITPSFSQEVAPLKTFEFSIGINKLKTQIQADKIIRKIEQIRGVKNCSLVLIDYILKFECTNHDMNSSGVLDVIKQILTEEGSEITTINRKTIHRDEISK